MNKGKRKKIQKLMTNYHFTNILLTFIYTM